MPAFQRDDIPLAYNVVRSEDPGTAHLLSLDVTVGFAF